MLSNTDYCDYDTCVALNELGCPITKWISNDVVSTFTLYEAQKWLREEKKIFVDVIFQGINDRGNYDYEWRVTYNAWFDDSEDYNACRYNCDTSKKYYRTYEEALLEGIKEAVKILKEGK